MFKKFLNFNKGMTYVELIVVLSIMGTLSAVVIFNGGKFQKRIETRNLADKIALKIVEAQKSALAGKMPPAEQFGQIQGSVPAWIPAYGVYFNRENAYSFVYFADLDNDGDCNNSCYSNLSNDEYIETIYITNNSNHIEDLKISTISHNKLSFVFTRPNSGAVIKSDSTSATDYGSIKIQSSPDIYNIIKVYVSGKIEIN